MTTKSFAEAMNYMDDDLISEAITYKRAKKKNGWLKWGTIAACLCLVVGICILTIPNSFSPVQNNDDFGEGGGGTIPTNPVEDDTEVTFTIFAPEDIITEIRNDITDKDTHSWTEAENTVMNYEHIVPVYMPQQLSKNDKTFSDTLAFSNQYIAPAISDGQCIGAFTIVKYNGEWVIDSYVAGLDIEAAIQQHKSTALCFVNIPQFGFEYGFLTVSDTGETYSSLTDTFDKISSGEELIERLREKVKQSNDETEG